MIFFKSPVKLNLIINNTYNICITAKIIF